jgi:hypothetical protein
MEGALKACWLILAAIHAPPAMVLFRPNLAETLYGIQAEGTVGLLVNHRGGLFLAVSALCLLATLRPDARRAASLAAGISLLSFLLLYAQAGFPPGPLRGIAGVDAAVLPLLAWAAFMAWRGKGAGDATTHSGP